MKFLTVAAKNVRLFSRDRTAIFWVIIFPLFLITFLCLIFRGGEVSIGVAMVQQDGGPLADAYVSALDNTGIFQIDRIDDVAEAEARVREGKVVAAVVIPPGFTAGTENVRLIYDEARGEIATLAVRTIEGVTQAFFGIQTRVTTEGVYGEGREWNPASHFVPGIGIMFILFSTAMGISADILSERKAGTFRRNLLAPITKSSFLGGYFLSTFLVGCLQVLVFLGVGIGVFGLEIVGSTWLVALAFALVILFGIGLGLTVLAFARSPKAAENSVQAIVWPLGMLGGLFAPVEVMPEAMRAIAQVLPTTHAMNAFRDVIVRGRGLFDIAPTLAVVACFAIAFLVVGLLLFKWRE